MTERSDRLRFAGTVLALVGWAFGVVTFLVLLADNHFEIGNLDVLGYAPPWAVLFGALAWVPDILI